MKTKDREPPAFPLADEAFRLVRNAPAPVLLCYFLGTIPFALGFLYFWSDMSLGPRARGVLPASALGLALLYVWMKGWQALYALGLRRHLEGEPAMEWKAGVLCRIFLEQALLQPSRFLLLPLAAVAALPFGWVHAFYENLTVLAEGQGARSLARQAWEQARLWPRQNHLLIWLFSPFLLLATLGALLGCLYLAAILWPHHQPDAGAVALIGVGALLLTLPLSPLGVIVWVNIAVALMLAPTLLRILGGVETVFTLSGIHALNTTFLLSVSLLAYLFLDPFLKAAYVLRCFEGASRFTGDDLLLSLRKLRRAASAGIVPVLFLGALCLPLSVPAQEIAPAAAVESPAESTVAPAPAPVPAMPPPSVRPEAFRQALERVSSRPEFSWKNEAGTVDAEFDGISVPFLGATGHWLQRSFSKWIKPMIKPLLKPMAKWGRRFMQWIGGLFRHADYDGDPVRPSRGGGMKMLLYVAGGLTALLLAAIVIVRRHSVRMPGATLPEAGGAAMPDLRDESVLPTDLPIDAWARLAQELHDKGEYRLALRAHYFSMLAALAERGDIRVGRSKSNRDYLREAGRKRRGALEALLRENLAAFERSWYGHHAVAPDDLALFRRNRETMLEIP